MVLQCRDLVHCSQTAQFTDEPELIRIWPSVCIFLLCNRSLMHTLKETKCVTSLPCLLLPFCLQEHPPCSLIPSPMPTPVPSPQRQPSPPRLPGVSSATLCPRAPGTPASFASWTLPAAIPADTSSIITPPLPVPHRTSVQ